jgi:hypothetical protein
MILTTAFRKFFPLFSLAQLGWMSRRIELGFGLSSDRHINTKFEAPKAVVNMTTAYIDGGIQKRATNFVVNDTNPIKSRCKLSISEIILEYFQNNFSIIMIVLLRLRLSSYLPNTSFFRVLTSIAVISSIG